MKLVEASSFCALLSGLKGMCVHCFFLPANQFQKLHMPPLKTLPLLTGIQGGCLLSMWAVGCVVCGVAFRNKRGEHASTSLRLMKRRNGRMWFKNTERYSCTTWEKSICGFSHRCQDWDWPHASKTAGTDTYLAGISRKIVSSLKYKTTTKYLWSHTSYN